MDDAERGRAGQVSRLTRKGHKPAKTNNALPQPTRAIFSYVVSYSLKKAFSIRKI
jgi:hypothetical protein